MVDGAEPAPGRLPRLRRRATPAAARRPPAAVGGRAGRLGRRGGDADALARRLFETDPPPAPAPAAAITSDRRDGFYLWWVFARRGRRPTIAPDPGLAAGR